MIKLTNPFSAMRRWMRRHHEAMSSFTTNFAAAVLGIVLTFGTTAWYNHKQNKEAAEAMVERCLGDMESRLLMIDKVVEFYDRHDSLYAQVESHPLDSLDDLMLGALIYEFTTDYKLVVNHAYEKSFSQSVSSHDILGEFAAVLAVGFEYLQHAEQQHAELNELQVELLKRQTLASNTYWDKGSVKEVVAGTLADPYFKFYQNQFEKHSSSVRHMQHVMKSYIPEARRLWREDLSIEDFRKMMSDKWNDWRKD